jgi:hypothetical protein
MKHLKPLIFSTFLSLLLPLLPVRLNAADFSMRLMPTYEFGLDSKFNNVLTGIVSLDLSPFTVRSRDEIYFSVQASPVVLMARNVEPVLIYNFSGAAGYNMRFTDRFSLSAEAFGGIWMLPEDAEKNRSSAGGPSFGGRLSANYYISPAFKASLFGGYQNYYYSPKPFLQSVQAGLGISINFTKGLIKPEVITLKESETQPLFPIFYAHYDNNSFGSVSFTNLEKNDLTDVEVSVFIEQFMSVPKVIGTYERIKPGEDFTADITAFLNESIMNQMQKQLTDAVVTVSYKNLGQKNQYENRFFLQTLTRNSMSWEDDRRAAAFVSAKDGAVQRFSRRIMLALRDKVKSSSNVNQLYARAVFDVLKAYGINYVIDPTSVFSTSDTVAVDFLQFPYQTLLYHGGDCDDLSILNCSLFEALGIQTAFITIPGHIYIAYDSGLTPAQADRAYGKNKYIVQDDIVWIPYEITVSQDSFELGLRLGLRQWNKYPEDHCLIPIHQAWTEFKPVTVPESDVNVQFPKDALK